MTGHAEKSRAGAPPCAPTGLWLVFLLSGIFLIAACSAQTESVLMRPTAPPETVIATPVPLILTPIATPQAVPPLPSLQNAQSSRALALYDDTLVTVNADSDSITIVKNGAVQSEIPVGDDPRTVAITPDGTIALVTLHGENALALVDLNTGEHEIIPIGHMPYGVVADARRAYVSNFADDQIAVLDLATREILYRVDVPNAPAGLALSDQWLLVTHFYSGQVSAINIARTPVLAGTTTVEIDGNLAQSIVVAPDGTRALLPMTRTGLSLISLQYMQDWFPTVGVLDVDTMQGNRAARMTLSMTEGSNMPFDAAFTPDGEKVLVVLAGSDAVAVIDVASGQIQTRIEVGVNPRAIVLDENQAYVLNALDGTLSVIDLNSFAVTDTLTVTKIPLPPEILRGKILFHSAGVPRMSDGAISCATCHFDGGMDTRTWINFRSGPRNTPSLWGIAGLPPYNWAGEMRELQDTIEDHIRLVMLGEGLIEGAFDPLADEIDARRSADLDALAAYVATFTAPVSPYRHADGTLTESARRGMQIFMSGSPGCSCHTPPLYTDQKAHNLADTTFSMETYGAFDTPSLVGLWASAPYMHDGVVMTLDELLTRTDPVHSVADKLTPEQLQDLIAFLKSL